LLLTIGIELPVYWLASSTKSAKTVLAAILINAFTNPLVLYCHIYVLSRRPWWQGFVVLELATVVIEALLFSFMTKIKLQRAMTVSLAANTLSAAAGFLLG
jgi:hypothetical protein